MKTEDKMVIPAWQRIIIKIEETENSCRLARDLNMTYSHVCKTLIAMQKKQWIKKEKIGRQNKITFTKKGEEVRNACKIILTSV